MDDIKSITKSTSIVRISICLHKIYEKILDSRKKNVAERNIKELDLLKTYCKTDNIQLCLMCCETFVKLVENGALELTNVLNYLLTLIPDSSFGQYTTISEGILNLLLLNLKRTVSQLKNDEKYHCPYGLKFLQHPIITLIQNNNSSNINDIANKIIGISNHQNKAVKQYSIEFFRPVCLYIFCNPNTIPDSKTIWTNLLVQSKTSKEAADLIREIIVWSKINSPSTCLYTSILLIEAIESNQNFNDKSRKQSNELIVYLCLITNHLIEYGIDPRPSLQCILRVLYGNTKDSDVSLHLQQFYNVILIILSKTLHIISPMYFTDLFRIFAFIINKENYGNQFILNMILDGSMQWIAQQQNSFIPPDGLSLAVQIVKRIIEINDGKEKVNKIQKISDEYLNEITVNIKFIHPDIALAFNIAYLAENLIDEQQQQQQQQLSSENSTTEMKTSIFTFVDSLNIKTKEKFCNRIQLFIRSLFLSKDPSLDCWFKIYQIILSILKTNDIPFNFLMTYIYKLAKETHPEIQLELFRGLPNFAISKDCIPMILNTIKSLSSGSLTTFCMDLYLRLWRIENRTFPFLQKCIEKNILSAEFTIAKAYTIREICQDKPSQYGIGLVSQMSDILNVCTKDTEDLPTSLTLDSVIILCENSIINVTSTWKAISGKFRHEKRLKSLQSLCKFFSIIPLFETKTVEYYKLCDEALDYLWNIISSPANDPILIKSALRALSNYDIEKTMNINHIPEKFKYETINNDNLQQHKCSSSSGSSNKKRIQVQQMQQQQQQHNLNNIIDGQIYGTVWVNLLQKIKVDCIEAAADLIAIYIGKEISQYRSDVYRIPPNVPEPRRLSHLLDKSPLKAITDFLVTQSRYVVDDNIAQPMSLIITNALRIISKKFPRPIPPLDWSFLHTFFHINFLTRKYCILIGRNQMKVSGTAKRLIENILIGFEPNIFEEDLLFIFDIFPDLVDNGASLQSIQAFVEKISTYCYRESQMNGFQEGCLFEKFLESMKYVFVDNKCKRIEVSEIFNTIARRNFDLIELDTRLFEKYTEFVAALNIQAIDELTLPSNWKEMEIDKLKKATLIRCYLALYNTNVYNPLTWLNPIVNAFATTNPSEQIFFFRHLSATMYAYYNDKSSCEWILELLSQIQIVLADPNKTEQQRDKLLFLLDVFVLSIVALSGCAILLGNLNVVATSREIRMKIFPESMQLLIDHQTWIDNEAKIYESFYSMYKSPILTDDYSQMFKNAIICSRNKSYFDNKNFWTKYVGMRK